jgi:hypothetical protein
MSQTDDEIIAAAEEIQASRMLAAAIAEPETPTTPAAEPTTARDPIQAAMAEAQGRRARLSERIFGR